MDVEVSIKDKFVDIALSDVDSPELEHIIMIHLPEWARLFAAKNAGYQTEGKTADELGPRAQFVDINRKIGKLKRALWEDKPLTGEPVEEVIQDLIGHLFLTLEMLARHG